MELIYKIMTMTEWQEFQSSGHYAGSTDDRRDGFIHFSDRSQVAETARRHFSGKTGLVLLAVATGRLGSGLRYEVSRGGVPFPHLYAALAIEAVVWNRPIAMDAEGVPVLTFPDEPT